MIKNLDLEAYRNTFLNLSLPLMTFSEPGPVIKNKIHKDLETTIWDQWEYTFKKSEKDTLGDLFAFI